MINDILKLASAFTGGFRSRAIASNKVAGLTISTVHTSDMGYETAICDRIGCHPVERYSTNEAAIEGHAKWLAVAPTLKVITRLQYGELIPAKPCILWPEKGGPN